MNRYALVFVALTTWSAPLDALQVQPTSTVELTTEQLAAFVGHWRVSLGMEAEIVREGDQLIFIFGGTRVPLVTAASDRLLMPPNTDIRTTDLVDGHFQAMSVTQNGQQAFTADRFVPSAAPDAVVAYGPDSLQFGELRLPPGPGPFPVVVGIHGGCWLDRLGEGSLTPALVALTEEGIATWNVEYRRLGHAGGGWPGTFLDVGAGVDHLRALADDFPLDLERVVLIGHSSGAHLAIWAAARPWLPEESPIRGPSPLTVTGAVGIDGPVDLARLSRGGGDVQACSEPVIAALMGGGPEDRPERYRDASPIEMPRLGVPVYLNPAAMILGLSDPDILKRRAQETGDIVTVVPVTNSDHFQLITPGHEAWLPVLRTIKTALGLR